MRIKVIEQPQQVISTEDAKGHLRIDGSEEDSLIDGYVMAAQKMAEHYTSTAIGSQTLELALDEFPSEAVQLPGGEVTSVVSVKYLDESNVEQTLDAENYVLDDYSRPCLVRLTLGNVWPNTLAYANAIKIRYVVGDLPGAVRTALLLIIAQLYSNRGDSDAHVPDAAKVFLDTVKVYG